MVEDYDRALALVRELHAMGARKVRVGEVEAEFGSPPVELDLSDAMGGGQEERDPGAERAARKRWEELQYYSAGGRG